MASKQELTAAAGAKVAATVDSLNSRGLEGTPVELTRDTWQATEAALNAGATVDEIRRASGLDGRQAGERS